MQRARVLTSFVGIFIAPFVLAASQAVAAAPVASLTRVLGHDRIRPRQDVPDDPLAGLPSQISDDGRGHVKGGGGASARAVCGVQVAAANVRDIGDLRATLAFVKHGPASWPCPRRAAQIEVRLRIGIDGAGKITAAEPVAGISGITSAMAKQLTGKAIGPRDGGATVGIVVVTFATGRPWHAKSGL
jgi:hypothetical protein